MASCHAIRFSDFKENNELYQIQKEIREKRYGEFFDLLSSKDKIKRCIGLANGCQFFQFFLTKVLNDLNKFENLSAADKKDIKLRMNLIQKAEAEAISKKREERIELYKSFEETFVLIKTKFGEGSYLDLCLSQSKFIPIVSFKNINVENAIIGEIKRMENNGWKNSPYNDFFYMALILNSINSNKKSDALKFAKKFEELRKEILRTDDEKNIVHVSYTMRALSINNEHVKCIDDFKKIDKKWLDIEITKYPGALSRVLSSYSRSLYYTNKKRDAMSYQELSLAITAHLTEGRKNELVEEDALFLRTILADLGEWKSLRNLEDRYYLKPLPKNPAEK